MPLAKAAIEIHGSGSAATTEEMHANSVSMTASSDSTCMHIITACKVVIIVPVMDCASDAAGRFERDLLALAQVYHH